MMGARMKERELRPRNDIVVIRQVARGKSVGGIDLPEISKEGVRFVVVAKGPKVEDLEIGDEVVPGGPTKEAEFYTIPGHKDLHALSEKWCMLVVKD